MRRLGVNEVDLLQVHWPDPWEQIPLKETMKAMEKLYQEGKIRAIGVSNFAVRDLVEAQSLLNRTEIVSNQVRYNLLQRSVEEEVIPYCRRNGITILAWSPLAQGALTGKYHPGNAPSGDVRSGNPVFADSNLSRIGSLVDILSSTGMRYQRTASQVALNWLASQAGVIPISGAKNPDQADQNVSSIDFDLSGKDLATIEQASRNVKIDYMPESAQ